VTECLFCNIVAGKVPSTKVYGDEYCYAFTDIAPQAPVHILIIPRRHVASLDEALDLGDGAESLLGRLLAVVARIARDQGLDEGGYRVVVNCGADGGQAVDHLHLHLLGGRRLTWPPG